ncbi:uncharacterized protein PV06_05432 [Exophiala oligosperma]|uniref:Amidohydrolase-related domain-containing protein n=2 Tax=Chaetothyriales TaxID=34395 RepID=A0A0D2DHC9_9EURO|nr:uncharacterized protein PV06_05432 [Exophiala oligosperma]KAJ9643314.1 hypothetical protein H2204_002210 [Knufia peltigerae]KIW41825.1 hypothetical protein PV06_05432 [Exophiala oligosperma]
MGTTIVHSVLLFDGNTTHQDATIAFEAESGIIRSVTVGTKLQATPDASVIDGKGCTLLPGFIDSHIHCDAPGVLDGGEESGISQAALRCGITTVCDMHSDPVAVKRWRLRVANEREQALQMGGKVSMPDLKSALYAATVSHGYPKSLLLGENPSDELKATINSWPSVTEDTASEYVKNSKENGADYIKLFQEDCKCFAVPTGCVPIPTITLQRAVTAAAHAEGLLVLAHANSVESSELVLDAGVDGLTHTFVDQYPTTQIVQKYKETNAFLIPTLTALSTLTGEAQDFRDEFAKAAERKRLVDPKTLELMRKSVSWSDHGVKFEYAVESVRVLRAQGIDILAGTDSMPGLNGTALGPSLWMELAMYHRLCAMSTLEVLRSTTSVPARRFGFDDRGVVEAGKRADLVLVRGDVVRDLQCLWEGDGILKVWRQGIEATL